MDSGLYTLRTLKYQFVIMILVNIYTTWYVFFTESKKSN